MTIPDEQYRIEQVQILNWGGYQDLQVMKAGRTSTALLGPSGRGKSTLLDAIASVIMPNPQEFNQAARDDKGRKRERTVYTYARGLTVSHQDDNNRSTTPSYLRPPSVGPFASGAAITWSTNAPSTVERPQRVTVFRLAWVTPDVTDNTLIGNATVYGFVQDTFDLALLDGLTPVRAGGSPLSAAAMRRLADPDRGDVVDERQTKVHAAMRRVMQMGSNEESQSLAMQLLRRAQASKGIFSIDDLFREFVLTTPRALARWDATLEHYTEASRLYDEFELAKKKEKTLGGLALAIEQYRAAGKDARDKRALRRDPGDGTPSRLQVWHAARLAEWARTAERGIRREMAQADDELQQLIEAERQEQDRRDRALEALTGGGADRGAVVRERIKSVQAERDRVQQRREIIGNRLAEFGEQLPDSSGDLALLRTSLEAKRAALEAELAELTTQYEVAVGERARLGVDITQMKRQIEQTIDSGSNIPGHALRRREFIAQGAGVPADQLIYIGELLEIPAEHRRWGKAILTIIRPLVSDLVVPADTFAKVRAFVNAHSVEGDITLVPGRANLPVRTHPAGTVASMLDLDDGRYRGWLSEELARFAYLCVESDTELEGTNAAGVVGRVTREGMRTASNGRVVKSDSRQQYSWIGRDNTALVAELNRELEGLSRMYDEAQLRVSQAKSDADAASAEMRALAQLSGELSWAELDLRPHQSALDELLAELNETDTPERRKLGLEFREADKALFVASTNVRQAQAQRDEQEVIWSAYCSFQDLAGDLVGGQGELTQDELAAAADIAVQMPEVSGDGLTEKNVDQRAAVLLAASYNRALQALTEQIDEHDRRRREREEFLLAIIRAYRNINERTARELDESIESLPTLESIHQQLIKDDLPTARSEWLTKVNAELNQGLRTLIRQIEVDAQDITHGLGPINEVLAGVPFRAGSHLRIEPVERANRDLTDFRSLVTNFTRDNPSGEDLFNDEFKVEAAFRRLRDGLNRITDTSKVGEAWRRNVFDARVHVTFRAVETPRDGRPIVHEGVSGMSGGEGQELIAFILGAALRYRLGEGGENPPAYGSIILDEGFVKADSDYTGRALGALQALGFQLIIGAPREKATAFEDYVDVVSYINTDPKRPTAVRIYSMTIQEALEFDDSAA